MQISRIELHLLDASGAAQTIELRIDGGVGEFSTANGAVAIAANVEHALGGTIVRATVANRGAEAVRLVHAAFEVATGIPPSSPARFFKHGYQSWSGSGAVDVGPPRAHPRDTASFIARVNHQSETRRPENFPESLTSELFTIVESPALAERVMVGFIDAAHALTTVTVPSPEKVIARAMLDSVPLKPGDHRALEPLYLLASNESAAHMAARWAGAIGRAMQARIEAPFQRGWCSWYHYFHSITEDALRANIRALAAMRTEFPIDVIQLDDGFQAGLGDWDKTNAKFPSGLRKIADEIHAAGFKAGIWTAPFLAARDSRLMNAHPDWFIKHEETGEPMRAGYNPNWTASDDKFAYALDPSNHAMRAHLEHLFARLTREFGYSYLKLDFLYAAAAPGIRHDASMTRGETLRRGLEAIRKGAGDSAFILGCGCPLGQAIGIVDGMRVGPDVAPFWGQTATGAGDPSTVYALDAIVARSFMHRRLWLNDPDCLMMRERETRLNADERGALAETIAASGGMLLISDDMAVLDRNASGALFRAVAKVAEEMDADAAEHPVLAIDLMSNADVRGLRKELPGGDTITMLLNRGDAPASIRTSDVLGVVSDATALDLATNENSAVFDTLEMPPHSARIVRTKQ